MMETEKLAIHNFLKSLCFESMSEAKNILSGLLTIPECSVNDLRRACGFEEFPFGDNYIWSNLQWDLLSNKYGAAHRYNAKTKKSYFVLQLPVPSYILKGETKMKKVMTVLKDRDFQKFFASFAVVLVGIGFMANSAKTIDMKKGAKAVIQIAEEMQPGFKNALDAFIKSKYGLEA